MARVRGPFDPEPTPLIETVQPALSVMAGSLVTLLPVIAAFPFLPPFGLLMLVGWRLARVDALPIWAPLLLGLFDDLLSGQPLGSAMLLWTVSFLTIDLLDQRLMTRDFWQDWLLGAGAVGASLIAGRLFATPLGAHVDTLLLLQILVSIMLYPLVAQLVAWLDRERISA
ncbi:rod shape-determining protein MreD [Sphingomonas sp.]|uniref:rod shape-determining protein MreD n=1 Tax=Sphingomonas sp. TaxID=28214 RepID=UPI001D298125|nr:rod shape-determining protein MreD [Sphingomonas sp.]MBX9797734.1 rod shape-determining protein MreD [Sphingomonas sp.]